ncbi:MAG: biopolymer transporter ExbD [Verrucomicrobiota bacterium]
MSRAKKRKTVLDLPIAPMIDVVFLLLIYFMVSSTIRKQEADLSFSLPGVVEQEEALEIPDEQVIVLTAEGQAVMNEFAYDSPEKAEYVELAAMLSRFRQASLANGVEARITISPDDETRHDAVVKVMDACARAKVTAVGFSL